MTDQKPHISVCICTYKRPLLLDQLLSKVLLLETEGLFTYSVIVVDNDACGSAKSAVSKYLTNTKVRVDYFIENEKNI